MRSVRKGIVLLILLILAASAFTFFRIRLSMKKRPDDGRLKRQGFTAVRAFSFSGDAALKGWQEKTLKGKTDYRAEWIDDEPVLHAVSKGTCSALYHKQGLTVSGAPAISWRWHVDKFPQKSSPDDLSLKKEDDFAARLYVIFPAVFFPRSKTIEYIWAENAPAGTIRSSPYSDNIKLFILRSGASDPHGWVREERDICADYMAAFGERPRSNIGGIAIMSDSDSTGTECEAYFDDIMLGYYNNR